MAGLLLVLRPASFVDRKHQSLEASQAASARPGFCLPLTCCWHGLGQAGQGMGNGGRERRGRFLCEIKKMQSFLPGCGRVNLHSLQKTDLHDFLKGGTFT